ncbi:MAG: GNAT family N-acetyltransferase [Bacteroidota bacterium]|nr:GNAT family N-acetyltransferase [Bacteroidota bacterium]
MIFESERLYVDKWKLRDLKALHELYNDPAIKEFILPNLTIEETRSIFENQLNLYRSYFPFGRYFIVEKITDRFIGILLFKNNNKKEGVEIGYSLVKDEWHKGYATEIVKESINWLFESEGFSSIYAVTDCYNESSKNVLLKCGFLQEKTFIEYGKKMSVFGLLKSDVSVFQ